uniref:Uncharacterized protein n=1 Tax=Arundo donax TaxID=35708 RepID=A0A0A9F821_ARUDO
MRSRLCLSNPPPPVPNPTPNPELRQLLPVSGQHSMTVRAPRPRARRAQQASAVPHLLLRPRTRRPGLISSSALPLPGRALAT